MNRSTFTDSEELSHRLRHTNVTAMQTNAGAFSARLTTYCVDGWSIQHVEMLAGASICFGASPADRHAFVVPRTSSPGFRLLGSSVDAMSFAAYTPGSEHADVTAAGVRLSVVVPPNGFIRDLSLDQMTLPRSGSHHFRLPPRQMAMLRAALDDLDDAVMQFDGRFPKHVNEQSLSRDLCAALEAGIRQLEPDEKRGRPALPRPSILKELRQRLEEDWTEPLMISEIASGLNVSEPTLRRIFIDWFDMPPARFLLLRRYYLVRRMLQSKACRSVSEAAHSFGFWNLSRFAAAYRSLFGEPPSLTLKKALSRA